MTQGEATTNIIMNNRYDIVYIICRHDEFETITMSYCDFDKSILISSTVDSVWEESCVVPIYERVSKTSTHTP